MIAKVVDKALILISAVAQRLRLARLNRWAILTHMDRQRRRY